MSVSSPGGATTLLSQDFDLLGTAARDNALFVVIAFSSFVLALLILFAGLQISGESQSRRLKKSLCTPRYRPLYDQAVSYALPRARVWAGVRAPKGANPKLAMLIRDAFTYRLLDRAMLLAVIYPLLSLLIFWGLTERDGTLGQAVVLPAVDPYWKGPAVLAILAFAGGGRFYVKWASKRLRPPLGKVAGALT